MILNLWIKMKTDSRGFFLYICAEMLLEFQWQIVRPWLEKQLCLGTRFISMLSLRIITQDVTWIYFSKIQAIITYRVLVRYSLMVETLLLIFLKWRNKIRLKTETQIRIRNLVTHSLQHMQLYDFEKQIKLLEETNKLL